jgi:hypothetical protein
MKHLILFLVFGIGLVAQAEEKTNFKELLSGKTVPLTLKLKDLTSDWRCINVSGIADSVANLQRNYLSMLGGGSAGGGFYTRGDTILADDETYLIAYRMQVKPINMTALTMARGPQSPTVEKLTTESVLALCLLHLRTVAGFSDIRPFDLETELTGGDTSPTALEEAREKAAKTTGLGNLRAIGMALLAYAQDGDKTLPSMKDAVATRKALEPYCKLKDAFVSPDSKEFYAANPSLDGRKLADIANAAEIAAFYETKPSGDTRAALFLDGHTARVPETKWAAIKKVSQIP